jgi:hypothetical protein
VIGVREAKDARSINGPLRYSVGGWEVGRAHRHEKAEVRFPILAYAECGSQLPLLSRVNPPRVQPLHIGRKVAV